MTGDFQVSVDPRRTKVLALRTPTGAPQLLGSNRHVTQGATDMGAITWDQAARTLSGSVAGAPGTASAPFVYDLAFHVPAGFVLSSATISGATDAMTEIDGEVLRLRFAASSVSDMTFVLAF